MRRIALTIAAAGLLGFAVAVPASAAPALSPAGQVSRLAPIVGCHGCNNGNLGGPYQVSSVLWPNSQWNRSTKTNQWYITPNGNLTEIAVGTDKFELQDDSRTNYCLTYSGAGTGPGSVVDTTCAGKASQQWYGHQCCSNQWYFENLYVQQRTGGYCTENGIQYDEVLTADSSTTSLVMRCGTGPEGYKQTGPNQEWYVNAG